MSEHYQPHIHALHAADDEQLLFNDSQTVVYQTSSYLTQQQYEQQSTDITQQEGQAQPPPVTIHQHQLLEHHPEKQFSLHVPYQQHYGHEYQQLQQEHHQMGQQTQQLSQLYYPTEQIHQTNTSEQQMHVRRQQYQPPIINQLSAIQNTQPQQALPAYLTIHQNQWLDHHSEQRFSLQVPYQQQYMPESQQLQQHYHQMGQQTQQLSQVYYCTDQMHQPNTLVEQQQQYQQPPVMQNMQQLPQHKVYCLQSPNHQAQMLNNAHGIIQQPSGQQIVTKLPQHQDIFIRPTTLQQRLIYNSNRGLYAKQQQPQIETIPHQTAQPQQLQTFASITPRDQQQQLSPTHQQIQRSVASHFIQDVQKPPQLKTPFSQHQMQLQLQQQQPESQYKLITSNPKASGSVRDAMHPKVLRGGATVTTPTLIAGISDSSTLCSGLAHPRLVQTHVSTTPLDVQHQMSPTPHQAQDNVAFHSKQNMQNEPQLKTQTSQQQMQLQQQPQLQQQLITSKPKVAGAETGAKRKRVHYGDPTGANQNLIASIPNEPAGPVSAVGAQLATTVQQSPWKRRSSGTVAGAECGVRSPVLVASGRTASKNTGAVSNNLQPRVIHQQQPQQKEVGNFSVQNPQQQMPLKAQRLLATERLRSPCMSAAGVQNTHTSRILNGTVNSLATSMPLKPPDPAADPASGTFNSSTGVNTNEIQQHNQQIQNQQMAPVSTVNRISHYNHEINIHHIMRYRNKTQKLLLIFKSGDQRLITFKLPPKSCTMKELLEQVDVLVDDSTIFQCFENSGADIDFVVTVGFKVHASANQVILAQRKISE